jgi:two-component system, LytTR family, sensor kinase
VKRYLPLVAILSSLALGASIVRGIAQLQLMESVGGGAGLTGRVLFLIETGNWLGWTAWAVILAVVMLRLEDRGAGTMTTIMLSGVLALAPLLLVPALSSPWHWLVTSSPGVLHSAGHIAGHNMPTNLLLGVAMVAVVQVRSHVDRTRRLERTAADLRAQLAESQLAVLRARLDPHFLFNALNSVMVLARRGEGKKVESVVEHLSALLRHSLDSAGAQVVPLRVELEVLRHYLDIEQVRHGDRLVVSWNIDGGLEDNMVPSIVLQPLVENAIRHGFTDGIRPLTVAITVARTDDGLVLCVEDDGEGLTRRDVDQPSEGIGLGHTRARLAGLYGDRAYLTLASATSGRGARVTIGIPTT